MYICIYIRMYIRIYYVCNDNGAGARGEVSGKSRAGVEYT